MKIGWKAPDGKMFHIDTVKDNIVTKKDLEDHIAKIRKEHGYQQPAMMVALLINKLKEKESKKFATDHIDDLDPSEQDIIKNKIIEAFGKPDPNKLD